jgi:murein tripeptide amidase MpaA
MTIDGMRAAVDALAAEFGIQVIEAPEKTWENRTMFVAVISKGPIKEVRTLFTAQMHARERGVADSLIYFMADLLWADREGTGLAYNGATFTAAEVKKALGAGIAFMPGPNPDGIHYDQETGSCFRKNRNPKGGVDLNRNFDHLWDFQKLVAPSAAADRRISSANISDDTYHGAAPFSEPETRNVAWVFDGLAPNISWFVDVHGFISQVGGGPRNDLLQHDDPGMSFRNAAYDGRRAQRVDDGAHRYREYLPAAAWRAQAFVGSQVANAMNAAYPERWAAAMAATQGVSPYPAVGDAGSWAFARHWVDPGKAPVHGFSIELPQPNEYDETARCLFFYPDVEAYNMGIRVGGAGYMQFLLGAAGEEFKAEYGEPWKWSN